MAKGTTDKYANIAAVKFMLAVAGTAAFEKFDFPFSVMDKVGLLISRLEYFVLNVSALAADEDKWFGALTVSKNTPSLDDIEDPTIIDSLRFVREDFGVAASGSTFQQPIIRDLSTMPGGGLLVAPNPLYVACDTDGPAAAMGIGLRMYYTTVSLSADDYWQLVESRRIITD